jgi:tRNA threonylcarbamoyl adenosine modification protein YeaZ
MRSPLLLLDLSSALYVGLWDGTRVAASRVRPQGTRGENAHALIDECLAEAGLEPGDLAALGVGVGPGSFTGIRVCGALAQGLAFARGLPLHPFSSLAAVATCLPAFAGPGPRPAAIAAIAANAGRWYVRAGGGAGDGKEALLSTDALLALAGPAEGPTGTGSDTREAVLAISGDVPERGRLEGAFGSILAFEDRVDFARLAALALASPPAPEGTLRPNYLAASAAEDKLKAGLLGVRAPRPGTSP